jgi:hypothetical protein
VVVTGLASGTSGAAARTICVGIGAATLAVPVVAAETLPAVSIDTAITAVTTAATTAAAAALTAVNICRLLAKRESLLLPGLRRLLRPQLRGAHAANEPPGLRITLRCGCPSHDLAARGDTRCTGSSGISPECRGPTGRPARLLYVSRFLTRRLSRCHRRRDSTADDLTAGVVVPSQHRSPSATSATVEASTGSVHCMVRLAIPHVAAHIPDDHRLWPNPVSVDRPIA